MSLSFVIYSEDDVLISRHTVANSTEKWAVVKALAILFAQTTGEGMGVWDWAGSEDFRDACARYVQERIDPAWPGLKPGDKCHPETKPFAEMFAAEWEDT